MQESFWWWRCTHEIRGEKTQAWLCKEQKDREAILNCFRAESCFSESQSCPFGLCLLCLVLSETKRNTVYHRVYTPPTPPHPHPPPPSANLLCVWVCLQKRESVCARACACVCVCVCSCFVFMFDCSCICLVLWSTYVLCWLWWWRKLWPFDSELKKKASRQWLTYDQTFFKASITGPTSRDGINNSDRKQTDSSFFTQFLDLFDQNWRL